MVNILEVPNPFQPHERHQYSLGISSVQEYWQQSCFDLQQQPFLCLIDGEAVMRKDWQQPIKSDCTLAVLALPAGGGGSKNPLTTISSLLLMGISPYLGSTFSGALASTIGISTSFASTIITAGVNFLGSLLIGSLFPPERGQSKAYGLSQTPSPTYSLQGRGNISRLGGAIPVIYGRHRIFPDLAASPWFSYSDNEQFLHQLHVIGQGYYDIEKIQIDDTRIEYYREVSYQIIQPQDTITLFNPDLVTAPEVSSQEILHNQPVGPFIVNPPDTETTQIHIDVVCPNGLYYAENDGTFSTRSTTISIAYMRVDNDGVPQGRNWRFLGSETIVGRSNTSIRRSYSYTVPAGRYMVQMFRGEAVDTSARVSHRIYWQAARATLSRPINHSGMTLLALRMRATNNLNSQNRGLINCIVTRKLPIWSEASGWSSPQKTRSIAWAIADIAKSPYGGGMLDQNIDMKALLTLDSVWNARKDYFDAVFDQQFTVWEALIRAARCGRAGCFLQAGILRTVRDQAQSLPVAMFTPRNIQKNSLQIDYRLSDEDTATAVTIEFHNQRSWRNDQTTISLESDTQQPVKLSLFGCTSEDHAIREGRYLALANRYRRKLIRFRTEMEGFIPTYGDLIALSHPMPEWGSGGEILSVDTETRILKLSEPPSWNTGDHYLAIRSSTGGLLSYFKVTQGAGDDLVVAEADADLNSIPINAQHPSIYAFGVGATGWRQLARVISIQPKSLHTVEIIALAEDDRVHEE